MANIESDDLRETYNKMISASNRIYKNSIERGKSIYAGKRLLKQYHKILGDDGFYNMISCMDITTNSYGHNYIQGFKEEYKPKKR